MWLTQSIYKTKIIATHPDWREAWLSGTDYSINFTIMFPTDRFPGSQKLSTHGIHSMFRTFLRWPISMLLSKLPRILYYFHRTMFGHAQRTEVDHLGTLRWQGLIMESHCSHRVRWQSKLVHPSNLNLALLDVSSHTGAWGWTLLNQLHGKLPCLIWHLPSHHNDLATQGVP